MAVTGTFTVLQIVTAAFRKINVIAVDETATADELANGIEALNWMLKAWQKKEWLTWTYTSGSLTLTTAASYTLSPVRPVRIVSARYKSTGGTETPMNRLTRVEYDELPLKTSTGIPTNFYYDRQKEAAKLYVWPVLSSATTESIEYTYERELEDIAAGSDVLDVPVDWHEAVIYNLASRLAEEYQRDIPRVHVRASDALDDVLAEDHEESVFFHAGS